MPGENQVYTDPQDPYYRKMRDYDKYRNIDDQYEERDTCINRLAHAFERLIAGLQKVNLGYTILVENLPLNLLGKN